jgi:hypothetical protein
MRVSNFGKNVDIEPEYYYTPETEADVLGLLTQHRGKRIRVIGRLHSWSEIAVCDDVILDMGKMNEVRVEQRNGESWAIIAGGAQIKHIVSELETKHGLTLPSLGLITEQTIAGAAATGTHGSGKHSLSHYVDEVRIAGHDPTTGEPVIRCIADGEELRAARCALGCLGVVLSVAIRCRPQYRLEQHFRLVNELSLVVDAEEEYPQQQFFLLPFRWDYLIQHRKETEKQIDGFIWLHRAYWFLTVDLALHVVLLALRRWLRSHVKQLLQFLDGNRDAIEMDTWDELARHGLDDRTRQCEPYTHHYPICIRKVLADDTLISMASSEGEAYYAISFISYDRPSERASFFAFAELLVKTTAKLFNARPHWGKYCPVDSETTAKLYPMLGEFRSVCEKIDPRQEFRNAWVDSVVWHAENPS